MDFETKLQLVDDKISYIRKELARILKLKDKDEKFQSLREIIVNLRNMDLDDLKVVVPSSDEYQNNTKDIRNMVADIQNQLSEISSYVTSNRQMMEAIQAKNIDYSAELETIKTSLLDIEKQLNDRLLTETMPDATKQMMLSSEIQQIKDQQQQMQQQLQAQQQQYKTIQGYQQQVQTQLPYYAPDQQQQVQLLQQQYQQQKDSLADSMRTTYRNLEQANKVIEALQRELEDLRRKCRTDDDRQRMDFTRRFQEMSQALAISENERRRLEIELVNSKKAIDALRADRNNLINQINANNALYQANLQKLSSNIQVIAASYNNLKGVSEQRYNAIRRALYQRNVLDKKIRDYATVLEVLRKKTTLSADEIARLKAKVDVLNPTVDALRQRLKNAEDNLTSEIVKTNKLTAVVNDLSGRSAKPGDTNTSALVIADNSKMLKDILDKISRLDNTSPSIPPMDYTRAFDDILRRIQELQSAQASTKDYSNMLNDIMQQIRKLEEPRPTNGITDQKLQAILDKMSEMASLKNQIDSLVRQVAEGTSTKTELDAVKNQLRTAEGDMVRLRDDLASRDSKIFGLQGDIDRLNNEIRLKKSQVEFDNLTNEISSLRGKMATMVDKKEAEALATQLREKQNELTTLQTKLSDFESSNRELEQQLNKTRTELQKLQQEEFDTIGAMNLSSVKERLDSIPALQKELADKKTELDIALREKNTAIEDLSKTTETLKELEKRLEESVGKQEFAKLEQEKKSLMEQITLLQNKLSGSESSDRELANKISANEAKITELQEKLKNADEASISQQNLNDQEQDKWKKQIEELQKQNAILESKLAEILGKNVSESESQKELQKLMSDQQEEIKKKEEEINSLNVQIVEFAQKNGEIVEKGKNQEAELKSLRDQNEKQYIGIEELEKKNIELNEELNSLKNKLSELEGIKTKYESLQTDLAELKSEKQKLNNQVGDMVEKSKFDELQEQKDELDRNIRDMVARTEFDKLQKEKDELDRNIRDMAEKHEQQLKEKQAELDALNDTGTEVEQTKKTLEKEVADLKAQMEMLKMAMTNEKEAAITELTRVKDADIARLQGEIDSLRNDTKAQDLETQIKVKEAELAELTKDRESQLAAQQAQIAALTSEKEQYQNQKEELDKVTAEKAELEKELQDMRQQDQSDTASLVQTNAQTEIGTEKSGGEESDRKIEELEAQIAEKDMEINSMAKSFKQMLQTALDEQLQEFDKDMQEKEEEHRQKLEDMDQEMGLGTALAHDLQEEVDKLTMENEKLAGVRNELQIANLDLQTRFDTTFAELESQKNLVDTLTGQDTAASEKIAGIEATMKMQISALKEQLEGVTKERSDIQTQLQAAQQSLEEMITVRTENETLKLELTTVKEQLATANSNVVLCNEQIGQLNIRITELTAQMAVKDEENQQLMVKLTELQTANTTLQEKTEELQKIIETSGNADKEELARITAMYNLFVENVKKLQEADTTSDSLSLELSEENRQVLTNVLERITRLADEVAKNSSERLVTLPDIKAGFAPMPSNDAENQRQRITKTQVFQNWWASCRYFYTAIKDIFLKTPSLFRLKQQLGQIISYWNVQDMDQEINPMEQPQNRDINKIDSNAIVVTDSTNKVPSREVIQGASISDSSLVNRLFVQSFYCAFDMNAIDIANNVVTGDSNFAKDLRPVFDKGIRLDRFRVYDAETLQEVIRELCLKGIEKSASLDVSLPNSLRQVQTVAILLDILVKFIFSSLSAMGAIREKFGSLAPMGTRPDTAIVSYMKIRIDNDDLDRRYKYKINPDHSIELEMDPKVISTGDTRSYKGVYGPFTNIFDSTVSNNDIGRQMTEVSNKLNDGKNVLIMALGPSGAGKTATLLARFDKTRNEWIDGCIPSMLKNLSRDVSSLVLTGNEVLQNYESGAKYWSVRKVFSSELRFVRSGSEWVLERDTQVSASTYLQNGNPSGVCELPNPLASSSAEMLRQGNGIEMVLADMVERRLNCGTSNNPDSSRSHLFLTMKMNNNAVLVVADLAGREKKFDCLDNDILSLLANNRWYPTLNKKNNSSGFDGTLGGAEKAYQDLIRDLTKVNDNLRLSKDALDFINRAVSENGVFNPTVASQMKNNASRFGLSEADVTSFVEATERLRNAIGIQRWIGTGWSVKRTESLQTNIDRLINLYVSVVSQFSAIEDAKKVCEIRTGEGSFINRSLDDFEKAMQYVISSSPETREVAPLVNDICFPINCAFADTTCFVNKPQTVVMNTAVQEIFAAAGTQNFFAPGRLTICPFLVVDFTSKPTIRIYTPYEDYLREILSYVDRAMMENDLIDGMKLGLAPPAGIDDLRNFPSMEVLTGIVNATKEDFQNKNSVALTRYYNALTTKYNRVIGIAKMTTSLEVVDPEYKYNILSLATLDKKELRRMKMEYEKILKEVSAENGNTAPGIMWNVDNMMKYYLTGRKRCVTSM